MRKLLTEAGERLTGQPWSAYPRPRLRREKWLCLNGDWAFSHGRYSGKIRVPFCPESLLSGVECPMEYGASLVYSRTFTLPEGWGKSRVLLHFGAVSRACRVFLNGHLAGEHDNGYLPFTLEITDLLTPGENTLRVEAVNDLSPRHPWGKQKRKPGGMWYTPVSGIWQTVWLEPVPEQYIHDLHVTTGPDFAEITAEGVSEGTLTLEGGSYPMTGGRVRVPLPERRMWSPEDPFLYRFTLTAGADKVESYFALRTLSVGQVEGKRRLLLNGRPYFFHALLDQGYWSDGIYTPAEPGCYEEDIRKMKALGFNTLRKHIKVEPQQFYYDCDRLGMLVFQDMVNCGRYHYITETVLPTIHLQRRRDTRTHRDRETRANFLRAMEETVAHLKEHPCICLWTIFNEGWGQFRADDAYDRLRALDPTRFIDATSGWFHQKKSDVDSLHIYFDPLHLGTEPRPQLLSEFGGYNWKLPEHSTNLKKTYGYKSFPTREEFVAALRRVYLEEVLPLAGQGLCGTVYTQVSDVEDETNGLLTYDRKVQKVLPEELRDIGEKLQEAVGR